MRIRRTIIAAAVVVLLCGATRAGAAEIDLAYEDVPTLVGAARGAEFGRCVAAGDLDGDGATELVVGAPGVSDTSGVPHAGAAYVFRLDALSATEYDSRVDDLAAARFSGSEPRERFATSVAVADLDGDGINDLAVGAPAAGGSSVAAGAVYVWFGRTGNWWVGAIDADVRLEGDAAGDRLGSTLLAADLDSDGSDELLVSAPTGGVEGSGSVYVLTGSALRSAGAIGSVSDLAAAVVVGESPGDELEGVAVADTDGDGEEELLLGSFRADGGPDGPLDAGVVHFLPAETVMAGGSFRLPAGAARSLAGRTGRGFFGRAVSSGDIDGDDADDVLLSAYGSKAGRKKLTAAGEAFVVFGEPGGSDAPDSLDDPRVVRILSRRKSDVLGLPVLLDDINGDTLDDIVISARYSDGPDRDRIDCGEVYAFRGSLRSVVAAKTAEVGLADIVLVGGRENDSIGEALLALDVDGVRGPELIVGAPDASRHDDGVLLSRCGMVLIVPGELLSR